MHRTQAQVPKTILKRDGSSVPFDTGKIEIAITKAMTATGERSGAALASAARSLAQSVASTLARTLSAGKGSRLGVEHVQDQVEIALMDAGLHETAKAYILYRKEHAKMRERDIFKKRINIKPAEYPEFLEYVDAIRHSYWIHTEFNFTSDIQDFKVHVSESERNAIKNAMMAIAQIEVAVKTFWGDIYKKMPKPEIGSVGFTFAESEVRHQDAYAHLLEILGLNSEFEKVREIPVIIDRIHYLDNTIQLSRSDDPREYAKAVLLFSLFIEHVSLFSQFLIMMSFNKHRNLFKGISNAVEATSKEEQIHGLFGIDLINQIKREHPDWFDEEYMQTIVQSCRDAFAAESKIVDWIFERGELDFLSGATVKEFIKNRFNNSLDSIGLPRIFEIDPKRLAETEWFDDEVIGTKHGDFFVKRSINYNKRSKSITKDDLF